MLQTGTTEVWAEVCGKMILEKYSGQSPAKVNIQCLLMLSLLRDVPSSPSMAADPREIHTSYSDGDIKGASWAWVRAVLLSIVKEKSF